MSVGSFRALELVVGDQTDLTRWRADRAVEEALRTR